MKPFQPKLLRSYRGQYGTQIDQPVGKIKEISVKYSRGKYLNAVAKNVDNFIKSGTGVEDNMSIFKSVLRQRIINGKQAVHDYNYVEISQFLPWVFSPKFLFQPFRSILYCAKNDISLGQAWNIVATLDGQIINQSVMKAIYQSVKYNASYVQIAKNAFSSDYTGYYTKIYMLSQKFVLQNYIYFEKILQNAIVSAGTETISSLLNKAVGLGKKFKQVYGFFKNKFYPKNAEFKPQLKVLNQNQQKQAKLWKGVVYKVIQQIFKQLRVYGQVIINLGYLKHSAQTKVIDGKVFYYFYDHPQILISISQSIPSVYRVKNGIVQKIPEQMFTIQFLRGIVMSDIVKLGGRLFKRLRQELTDTKQQMKARQTFRRKYLKVNIPTDSSTKQQNRMFESYAQYVKGQTLKQQDQQKP